MPSGTIGFVLQKYRNTGIAVTYDIGDEEDIHPKNKYDVGERLALWALAHDYGKEISFSGPLYKTITLEEDRNSG